MRRRFWFAVACGLTAAAKGDVVPFSNADLTFWWQPFVYTGPGNYLDITRRATQPGDLVPISLWWNHAFVISSTHGQVHRIICGTEILLARSLTGVPVPLDPGAPVNIDPPLDIPDGGTVGGALNWQTSADIGWIRSGYGDFYIAGAGFTMGLRFTLPDGVHYGYARCLLGPARPNYSFLQYHPVEWGYETLPGVALTIPPTGCYTNCDGSSKPPVLNVNDFICFQQ